MRHPAYLAVILALGLVVVANALGQTGQTAQPSQSGQTTPTPAARPRPRPASAKITVRDNSGTPLADVQIGIIGSGSNRSLKTDADGTATTMLDGGAYRLRFDRVGFITVERDVTLLGGRTAEVDVALDLAPPPPPPPPPPPAPVPPPKAEPPAADATKAAGPPVIVSLPTFLDKNYLGRDPLKESIVGCTPSGTTRLLQMRDPLAMHTHANMDEVLYVVAGEGTVQIGEESSAVSAGTLSIIPRGVSHAIERRGKNPMILLSTLSGAPCQTTQPTAQK